MNNLDNNHIMINEYKNIEGFRQVIVIMH
jgi:hypothetical protein